MLSITLENGYAYHPDWIRQLDSEETKSEHIFKSFEGAEDFNIHLTEDKKAPHRAFLDDLPCTKGLYIVSTDSTVLYIGIARNFRKRWRHHHRTREIIHCTLNSYHYKESLLRGAYDNPYFEITTIPISCLRFDLLITEQLLINELKPLFNDTPVYQPKNPEFIKQWLAWISEYF